MNKLIILIFILIQVHLNSQTSLHSIENRLRFAEHLENEKDHLRASEEYDHCFRITGDTCFVIKSAHNLFLLGNYHESVEKLNEALTGRFSFKARLLKQLNNLYIEVPSIEEGKVSTITGYSDELLLIESYDRARRSGFNQLSVNDLTSSKLIPDDIKIQIRAQSNSINRKSEISAALMSAVLPGSGKIYTGDYSDGVTTLLTTSLFVYLSVINFNAGHEPRGYIFALSAAGFYSGGIYGSYVAARKNNLEAVYTLSVEIDNIFRDNFYFFPGKLFGPCDE